MHSNEGKSNHANVFKTFEGYFMNLVLADRDNIAVSISYVWMVEE